MKTEAIKALIETSLLRTCGQCGQRISDRACGPTHAVVMAEIESARAELAAIEREVARLVEALTEIAKREGRFSLDHKEHAMNTIENMGGIADAALLPFAEAKTP